ncbi:conserved hypothetical protein [Culex quinquefasciatus]|uniref:V-type proton ATPase subunit S1/VOA1 transmembrane domain-containing protein n=1 Tax=Culex quinquefasciatus TaxID=7176 RepID=B0XDR5_CULQU|nr:conserved hypothetical protein [Culex quinquefasciatus]|eukprot:XP_001867787.1 conserved hypothetical protein [Culex quinquefasciatus]
MYTTPTWGFLLRDEPLAIMMKEVQPAMDGSSKFGSAWDCIGFTTAPIWSGIFVTSIMAIMLAIAICAILDIKPPNRFESRTGKQLSFTVQE